MVLEKTLESPLERKEIKPDNVKGNQPWILIGRMTLKLQYFGHLMQTTDSLEKFLMLGKIEGRKKRGHHRVRWLNGITDAMDMNLGKLWEMGRDRQAWHAVVHGVMKSRTWLCYWTATTKECSDLSSCTVQRGKKKDGRGHNILSSWKMWLVFCQALNDDLECK